jgi:signal transduction histidine kinase
MTMDYRSVPSTAASPKSFAPIHVWCTELEPSEMRHPHAAAERELAILGEITGGIAHDFLNILAVINSGLVFAQKTEERQEVRGYLTVARSAAKRGVNVMTQLLEFSKQREFEPSLGDVNELLRDLDIFIKHGAGPTIGIGLNLGYDIPKCLIDSRQFSTAVLNLVTNARDAMPAGGDIRISTKHFKSRPSGASSPLQGEYVRVRIQDNGGGMSSETASRIFEPLFTTKGQKGTGLGLPQVCAFMRRVGGRVSVISRRGVGTAVDLFFPVILEEKLQTR